MPKPKLPFLYRYVSRHGKVTYCVKLSDALPGRGVRIQDPVYRSDAFMVEYHAAVRGMPINPVPAKPEDSKATVRWLIAEFRNSHYWTEEISGGTRKQRGPILTQIDERAGDLPPAAIDRTHVEDGMKTRTKNQARHFVNTVSALFKWAIEHNHFDGRNPTDGIRRKGKTGKDKKNGDDEGHLPWPPEVIEQFERRWPVGTKERLALDVFLYVGLRRGDAAALGKQHMPRGIIHLKTEKNGTPIWVPVNPRLAESIKACPSTGLAIIAKPDGTNYTKESLGNWFREAIEKAGIPLTKKGSKRKGYSAHGLRKASATIAAENNASESVLNAMFGWSGYEMAQHYTKNADRKRLAARGFAAWRRPSSADEAAEANVVGFAELAYLHLQPERNQDAG